MPTVLPTKANEGSTYVVDAAFTDENDAPVTPNAVTWTLTNERGSVVNARLDVVETPATTVSIVLQGADLIIPESARNKTKYKLKLLVEGDYDSSLGSGLPFKDEATLTIYNFAGAK